MTGHLLELPGGRFCGGLLQARGVIGATSNRGVLAITEQGQAVDGGEESQALYFDQGSFGLAFDAGILPPGTAAGASVVAGAGFRSSAGVERLEVQNRSQADGGVVGETVHKTGGLFTNLPCAFEPMRSVPVRGWRGLDGGLDVLVVLGHCDGGTRLVGLTEERRDLTWSAPFDAGDSLAFDVSRGKSTPVLSVMHWLSDGGGELEVTRYDVGFTGQMTRRVHVGGQLRVEALSVDDFDQPVVLLSGGGAQLTDQSGVTATVSASSSVSLLQLDAQLRPVRYAGVDYPALLKTRSMVATGGAWVLDAVCRAYDGGTAWPCPSDRSSFAMRLVFPDGGSP